jgi:hypothetical protein
MFQRAASYVDRILRGEKLGDPPVQTPTKYKFFNSSGETTPGRRWLAFGISPP